MVEEGGDQRGVEVAEVELRRCLAGLVVDEPEQEAEGVTGAGRDRVRARVSLAGQPIGEEGLDQGGDLGHAGLLGPVSARAAASSSSSGTASRYQYRACGFDVAEHGRQLRQEGGDVGSRAVPLDESVDRKGMYRVMDTRTTPLGAPLQARTADEPYEHLAEALVDEPGAGRRDEQARPVGPVKSWSRSRR